MDSVKPFLQFLQKFIDLSEEEFNQWVLPYLQIRKFNKRQVITEVGQVENYLNFILKGLVRKYYKHGHTDQITQISTEEHIIYSRESFHTRTPSEYCIEAIEPTILISITQADLEKVYSQNAKMERLGRLVPTSTMVAKDRWQINLTRMSPRERFIDFVSKNPELVQRVPQKYLASYLNIQPETFSRFKHLLQKR